MNTPTMTDKPPANAVEAAKKEIADLRAAAAITAQAVRTAQTQYSHADGAYLRSDPSRAGVLSAAEKAINEAINAHNKNLSRLQAAEAGLVAEERRIEQEKQATTAPKSPTADEEEAAFTAAGEDLAAATRAYLSAKAKIQGIEAEIAAAVIQKEDLLKSQAPVEKLAPALSTMAGTNELLSLRLKEARENEAAALAVQKQTGNLVRAHVNQRIGKLCDKASAAQQSLRESTVRSPLMALSAKLMDAKSMADGEAPLPGFSHGEKLLELYEILSPRLCAIADDTHSLASDIRDKVGAFAERAERLLEEGGVA